MRDFTPGTERLRLDDDVFAEFDATISATLDAGAFLASASAVAQDPGDRILHNTGTGGLFYDPDGSGAAPAVRFATLTGEPVALSAADFLIVG